MIVIVGSPAQHPVGIVLAMSDPLVSPSASVTGATPAQARKLILAGWSPLDDGLWALGSGPPCQADAALTVADFLAKSGPVCKGSVLTHISSSFQGTAVIGLGMGFVATIVANPPPSLGLSPTTVTWVQWGVGILATVLLGTQVPASMKAVKS